MNFLIRLWIVFGREEDKTKEDTSDEKPTEVPEGIAEAIQAERAGPNRELGLLLTGGHSRAQIGERNTRNYQVGVGG